MTEQQLIPTTDDWQEQIAHLRANLDELLPQLVEAEAELAERYAAINAFEFHLRSAISFLTRKLEELDAQIHDLRQTLRGMDDTWYTLSDEGAAAWARRQSATEQGEYRYREAPTTARPDQDADTRAELKRLYRQLARWFHPDLAVDEADRAYRTQMMMAINAAYAAGDLAKLRELATAPGAAQTLDYANADQKVAEMLLREVTRVRRRLAEIQQEILRLEKHESARMMKQMAEAEADGRSYFDEIKSGLRDLVAERTAVRDSLQMQLESATLDDDSLLTDDELADIVWDVSLDTSFDDEFTPDFDRYIRRRTDKVYFEEDFDDDYE